MVQNIDSTLVFLRTFCP